MFERFDEQARQAVVLAQEEAVALKHDYIGAQHLLLGVLAADPELATVPPDRIRDLLEPGTADSPSQLPFSAVAKRALETALREAMALGHRRIVAAHILLALAAERAVRDLLDRAGAEALADRERTTARANAVERGVQGGDQPLPAADPPPGDARHDAERIAMILSDGGPVADMLREHGVDYAALEPFLGDD